MFHIVLFEPEIPPNTGNIIRLCANTGAHCHLIEPLGFELDDKRCQRAGLDYHDLTVVTRHASYEAFLVSIKPNRLWFLTTKAARYYTEAAFEPNDAFVFGPETRGLPSAVLDSQPAEHSLIIPQLPTSRSLNLSNAVAITLYEAWRQQGFAI